jgi:uncharacterized protein
MKTMRINSIDDIRSKIPQILDQVPYLEVLVLFGSHARGEQNEASDWDFAVLYNEEIRKKHENGGWDAFNLHVVLSQVLELPDDELDLVRLQTCSGILAHGIAQDGLVIYESKVGQFENFRKNNLKSQAELKFYRQSVRVKVYEALARWKA